LQASVLPSHHGGHWVNSTSTKNLLAFFVKLAIYDTRKWECYVVMLTVECIKVFLV